MVNAGLPSMLLCAGLLGAGVLCAAPAAAEVGCAGDGEPPSLPAVLSGLLRVQALPYAGGDLSRLAGDPGDAGVVLAAEQARLALCGRVRLGPGALVYNFGYEPYSAAEAARADAAPWGRVLAAELGYPAVRWLTVFGGVRKVAFSYGHDEPEGALSLPVRPFLSESLAPDRRLGVTVDDDWGAARVLLGVYDSARTLQALPQGGLLATARGVLEPLGPVGRVLSTRYDDPYWAPRFRIALNASALVEWDPRTGDVGYALGGDVPLKIGPLGLVAEYLYAHDVPVETAGAAPGLRADRQGAWVQAALMLLRPYLELSARYEWFDMPADDRERFHGPTAGVTFVLPTVPLQLQAAYGHRFHYAGPAVSDDYLLLLLQFAAEGALRVR